MSAPTQVDLRPLAAQEVAEIRDELARRSAVRAADIEGGAQRVRELSVELFRGGWDLEAEAAARFSERLDETAELAKVIDLRKAEAAG